MLAKHVIMDISNTNDIQYFVGILFNSNLKIQYQYMDNQAKTIITINHYTIIDNTYHVLFTYEF